QRTFDRSHLLPNRAAHTLFEMDCSAAVHAQPMATPPSTSEKCNKIAPSHFHPPRLREFVRTSGESQSIVDAFYQEIIGAMMLPDMSALGQRRTCSANWECPLRPNSGHWASGMRAATSRASSSAFLRA